MKGRQTDTARQTSSDNRFRHTTARQASQIIIVIIIIIMSIFLEHLSLLNMLNCAEQGQIQKYKAHAYKTLKTAGVQTIMLKHPDRRK